MTNTISLLDGLKSQIRPHLKTFLLEEGVNITDNGMFVCINPNHQEKTASMRILPDLNNEQIFCYGCNATGDIFTAHQWLSQAPSIGHDFILNNIYKLADRFEVAYEPIEYTEEQLEIMAQYRFTKILSDLLIAEDERGELINMTYDNGIKRGWTPAICKKLKIATVLNYDKFVYHIQNITGYTQDEIKRRGGRSSIFGPDRLTITLFDEKGRPLGFTARDINWTKGSVTPKYINTDSNSIFKKTSLLYGINLCSPGRRLDIFEGNGSFVRAFQEGHKSCCALSSSNISEQQVNLMVSMGFNKVNLILDDDKTGLAKMDKHMEHFSGREGLEISMTKLKFKEEHKDSTDPEDFIALYGLAELFKLKEISAFQFYIEKESKELSPTNLPKFITKMIKLILNTENRISRGQQIAELVEATGVAEVDIRDEIDRIKSDSIIGAKKDLFKLQNVNTTDDLLAGIDMVRTRIEDTIGSKEDRNKLSINESLCNFTDFLKVMANKKPGIQGWKTGFQLLDIRLSGIPKPVGFDEDEKLIPIPGSILGFAGVPQHGKSTVLQNLALNIALLNDDVSVLFWALDDSRERTYERMLSMHSGVDWKSVTGRQFISSEDALLLKSSQNTIATLVSEGRLVLKDHSIGSSLPMLRRWIEITQTQSDRPVLVVLDSFHKIGVSPNQGMMNEVAKAKANCQYIKSLVQTHHITLMASLEMNKQSTRGQEPDLLQITETRKIEYDFDIVSTVFNHYYDTDGESDQIIGSPDGSIKPLIKVNIRKSKDGGAGPIFFALNQRNFQIEPYSMDEIRMLTDTVEVKDIQTASGTKIVSPDKGNLVRAEPWDK